MKHNFDFDLAFFDWKIIKKLQPGDVCIIPWIHDLATIICIEQQIFNPTTGCDVRAVCIDQTFEYCMSYSVPVLKTKHDKQNKAF